MNIVTELLFFPKYWGLNPGPRAGKHCLCPTSSVRCVCTGTPVCVCKHMYVSETIDTIYCAFFFSSSFFLFFFLLLPFFFFCCSHVFDWPGT